VFLAFRAVIRAALRAAVRVTIALLKDRKTIYRDSPVRHHELAILPTGEFGPSRARLVLIQLSRSGAGRACVAAADQQLRCFAEQNLCGAERDRTDDLRLAKPALSQLSYSPSVGATRLRRIERVGQGRVELPTSRLSGVRSNHLSYWPSQSLRRLECQLSTEP
jgi:hypothetical protein